MMNAPEHPQNCLRMCGNALQTAQHPLGLVETRCASPSAEKAADCQCERDRERR